MDKVGKMALKFGTKLQNWIEMWKKSLKKTKKNTIIMCDFNNSAIAYTICFLRWMSGYTELVNERSFYTLLYIISMNLSLCNYCFREQKIIKTQSPAIVSQ